MPRWEYALFSNPASGDDGVTFSHPQPSSMVKEFSAVLGRGLKAENSNVIWLHINMNHTNMARVCGLLGERGWEMVGFSTLTGGHAYMMFRRQLPGWTGHLSGFCPAMTPQPPTLPSSATLTR